MWWKLLVGVLAIAAIYAPLAVSAAARAKQKREQAGHHWPGEEKQQGGEADAGDEAD